MIRAAHSKSGYHFHKPLLNAAGFTLLELMIVIAIIATLSGLAIPSFNNYISKQNLRQSQDQIRSDLRAAQIRALNGVKDTLTAPTYWGIGFRANQSHYVYILTDVSSSGLNNVCQNALNANWSSLERSQSLPAGIQTKNNYCVFFNFENGNATNLLNTQVLIGYPGVTGTNCYSVTVNGAGTVYEGADPVSCT